MEKRRRSLPSLGRRYRPLSPIRCHNHENQSASNDRSVKDALINILPVISLTPAENKQAHQVNHNNSDENNNVLSQSHMSRNS